MVNDMKIYQLYHLHKLKISRFDQKLLGFFCSKRNINSALKFYKTLPGFSQDGDGSFMLNEFTIDDEKKGIRILKDQFGKII